MAEITGSLPKFELDVFQIMPNHMHGIIILNDSNPHFISNPNPNPHPLRAGFNPAPNKENDYDIDKHEERATARVVPQGNLKILILPTMLPP